jgi:hypothetical protein
MQFLQENGESEALLQTRKGCYRDTLEAAIAIYNGLFARDQRIFATFEFINFTGWKFHPDQQKAM